MDEMNVVNSNGNMKRNRKSRANKLTPRDKVVCLLLSGAIFVLSLGYSPLPAKPVVLPKKQNIVYHTLKGSMENIVYGVQVSVSFIQKIIS